MERRRRRTWGQRAVIVLLGLAITGTGLLAVALGEVARVTASIDRAAVSPVLDPPSTGGGDDGDDGPIPSLSFLVVGVDGVDGVRDDGSGPRNVLADSMIIVRTTPTGAEILPLPRDLWGEIPGHGEAKLNAAMAFGEARLLIETIRHRYGLEINHYVQIDFAAFVDLIDHVGGIDLHMPAPARDRRAGLDVDGPGCVHLDGEHAFRLARSRYYDALIDGEWERDPTYDLGRIRRQQVVLRAALTAAIDKGARNPVALRGMVTDVASRLTIDDALSLPELIDLGQKLRSVDVDAVTTFDLAVVDARHEGQDALDLVVSPENEALLDRFRPATTATTSTTPPTTSGPAATTAAPPTTAAPTTTAPPPQDPLAPFTPTLC